MAGRDDIEAQATALPHESKGPSEYSRPGDNEKADRVEVENAVPSQHVGTLDRKLKSRHVQFLALSGAIGTGLFVGSGQVLSLSGPLAAFLSYAITGFNLYCVINSLGEMAAWLPIPGAVPIFAARFVDPALGFTLGWNYWYQFAIGVPIEVTVSVVILDFWDHSIPAAALITIFFLPMVIVNCFPVRIYGEAEFAFGAIKLTTIVGLILLMFIITVGGAPTGGPIGFRYWNDPGPMNEYLRPGALGRFLAFWKVFIQATFSYGGSEMVVVASGETENPRRNIPKAIRRVFWRIAIFYVLAIFLVGLCVSSRDPKLINAVVLSSAWSAGNSFFYASTRVLYAAALDGKAPAFLKFERFGVPYACVGATTVLSLLVYLNVNSRAAEVFFWFSNVRFYNALKLHGVPRESMPYRAWGQPYLAYFAICFCLFIAFFNGFDAFFPGRFSAKSFIPPYIDIPIFLSLFLGYKFVKKTKFVKLEEMDIWSGKAEIDRLEPTWPIITPRNWLERIWFWIA